MEKKLILRADLDKEMADKFFKLKEKWGLKSNSEVLRHLIQRMYKELVEDDSE